MIRVSKATVEARFCNPAPKKSAHGQQRHQPDETQAKVRAQPKVGHMSGERKEAKYTWASHGWRMTLMSVSKGKQPGTGYRDVTLGNPAIMGFGEPGDRRLCVLTFRHSLPCHWRVKESRPIPRGNQAVVANRRILIWLRIVKQDELPDFDAFSITDGYLGGHRAMTQAQARAGKIDALMQCPCPDPDFTVHC